jgi:hypothetical protein
MDFEILAPGHGALGSKADVTNFRLYLEHLRAPASRWRRRRRASISPGTRTGAASSR